MASDAYFEPALHFTAGDARVVNTSDDWFQSADDPDNAGDTFIYPIMNEVMQAVDNGIIFVSSMVLLIFICLGVGWYVIYNIDAVNDEIVTRDFVDAFQSVTFIISLVANTLILEARIKSTARPRMYDALLHALHCMTRKMTGIRLSIVHEAEGREWRRANGAVEVTAETATEVKQHMHDIGMYMFVMTRYSYIVFQPRDPHADYLQFVSKEDYGKYEDILSQTIGARFKQEATTNIFSNAILFIEAQLMHMHHTGVIPSGTYTNLATVLDDIASKVHDINVSMRIATPRIFDQTSYAVLFIYLVILLPLQVYSNVSWWMMGIYPLALFIYVSNILFGEWMGDPFIAHPRFAGAEVIAWRHQLYAVIHELLLRDIKVDTFGAALHRLESEPSFIKRLQATVVR